MSPSDVWTRAQVAQGILAGDSLIILDGFLLKVPQAWLDRHPGGRLAILHFVGRDATDEISAFHSGEALKRMKRYIIGKVEMHPEDGWEPFLPPVMSGWLWMNGRWTRTAKPVESPEFKDKPTEVLLEHLPPTSEVGVEAPTLETIQTSPGSLSPSTQFKQSLAYRRLHQQVIDAGLYETPFLSGYGPEITRYLIFASLSIISYRHGWTSLSALFLGLLWHQLTFTAHDLGHNGVTHNWAADRVIGAVIADLIGGLSIGWWVDNHNIHHLVTNHPSHDPDIQHIPFFAISPHFSKSLWSSYYSRIMPFDFVARIFIPFQHILFYIVMSLARFNLYANSYSFLYKRARDPRHSRGGKWVWWMEFGFLLTFWTWYSAILYGCGTWRRALVYLLISHIVPSPLHVQIVLSHFSMSTDDLGPVESFPHRQLRTTTDVICPDYLAFAHGGLQLQVTHHLFPRLPRHNLKTASALVKKFAKEEGLHYAEFGFIEGNNEVRGVLRDVANQVSIVKQVADSLM